MGSKMSLLARLFIKRLIAPLDIKWRNQGKFSIDQYLPGGWYQHSNLYVRLANFSFESPLYCMAEPEINQLNRS